MHFCGPGNFYSRNPDLFHTLLFILHLVLFFHQWFLLQQLLAFIPKEEYYCMLENGVSAFYYAYFFCVTNLRSQNAPKVGKSYQFCKMDNFVYLVNKNSKLYRSSFWRTFLKRWEHSPFVLARFKDDIYVYLC